MTNREAPSSPETSPPSSVPGEEIRLVGIGASAGGLEALRELVESLPDSETLGYVIAQHLSPTHVSMLSSLLSPLTALAVEELHEARKPQPRTVYVTPPNKDIRLERGVLCLADPDQKIGPKPSVNALFQSLAEELGEQAIGIVLSGTGSDGSQGLRAIKAAGGITIAQEPDSARYDSMPRSAIHTGSVDLILRPAQMGPTLDRLITQGQVFPADGEDAHTRTLYRRIDHLVRANTAFRLSDYKSATVQRRIARRMQILGLHDLQEYLGHLKQHREEAYDLVRDTFISVTAFFRDTEPFLALQNLVDRIVRERPPHSMIRCWVPGCASGEEAYSIAMLFEYSLHEQERTDLQYMIFASDLDEKALEDARAGLYPPGVLEAIPEQIREHCTEPLGEQVRIIKELRRRLVFARQNVIEDPPFARMDLISCRNLLIYLRPEVQERVLEIFHYSLNPNGCLFLGKAETPDNRKDLFRPLDHRARIYQRAPGQPGYVLPMIHGTTVIPDSPAAEEPGRPANAGTLGARACELLAARYAPPSLVIDGSDAVVHFQGDLNPFLDFPRGRAGMSLFDLLPADQRAEIHAMVYRCRRDLCVVEGGSWSVMIDDQAHRLRVLVSPLEAGEHQRLLLAFQATPLADAAHPPARTAEDQENLIIHELEQELVNTRLHLNVVVEELQTANEEQQSLNEELQSTNEELQSANEELQTSNEELQSTNEELLTVNEELQTRSTELEITATDLVNVKESLTFPLIVVDTRLRLTQINAACHQIFEQEGHPGEFALGNLHWLVRVPDLSRHVRRVIETGTIHQEQIPGDHQRIYELNVMPCRGPRAEVAGAVLLFLDITAQRQAEEALRASHERFELAMRGSNDGIWDWDILHDHLYWSARLLEIIGYQEGAVAITLEMWKSWIHPEERETVLALLDKTLSDGSCFVAEYRMRHARGRYIWILARGRALLDETGKAIRMAGSVVDISDRKRYEVSLQESEQRMRLAAETTGIGFWEWNVKTNSIIWDRQMFDLYGLAPTAGNRVTYDDWRHRVIAEDLPGQEEILQRLIREKSRGDREFRIRRQDDGEERIIHAVETVRLDHSGEVEWVVGTNIDVTRRRRDERALIESEERFFRVMHEAPTGLIMETPEGRLFELNPAFCHMLGYSREDLIGRDIRTLTHPDDRTTTNHYLARMQNGEIETHATSKRYLHQNGGIVWAELNLVLIRDKSGAPHYLIGQIQDVTQRKHAEEELRLAASVFSNTLDSIVITNPQRTICKVNQAFERLLGYTSAEVIGQPTDLLHPDHQDEAFYDRLWEQLREKGCWQGEVWYRHKKGHLLPLWLSTSALYNEAREVERYIAIMYDISEQKASQERINYLAQYDALTGLPNRSLFMDRLEHALSLARRHKHSLALMFIDLDNFKHVNDFYGHPMGDELLCEVARRLKRVTRASDTVARLSGDEFTLLVEDADNATSVRIAAEKCLSVLAEPIELGGGQLFISASIGVAQFPQDGKDISTLLKHADLAMYRSKEGGRNQFHFYTRDLSNQVQERMLLHNDLRQALNEHGLDFHFQPIIQVDTRHCIGAEILARWHHRSRGVIPPDRFIPVAEEDSLIHQLGAQVLHVACRQVREWQEQDCPLDFISVNVSGKQLARGDFLGVARRILEETGCPAERITLELTESFIMHESEGGFSLLSKLRDLGFGIAIDDFGTGYSSLSYLKRLPVTKLKLDRSFVRDIPADGNDVAIARAILRLGETLGLEVMAEGVETEAQHSFIATEGCAFGQGYLYARPMPVDSFGNYLQIS